MIRIFFRKFMAVMTAIFWTEKSKFFSSILACFWSVQHIACAYGTEDCDYDGTCPVIDYGLKGDTVATIADLGPCVNRKTSDEPIFVSSENSDYFCSENQWLSAAEVLCEEKAPITPFEYSTFLDSRDGYMYRLTTIGSRTWFAENLRYETGLSYTPSDPIFNVVGRYYTWKDAQKACPEGFHLPSSEEWEDLWTFVSTHNGCENVGTSLKTDSLWKEYLKESTNIVQGNERSLVGTNRYGFNAVPAGTYFKGEGLTLLGELTRFWAKGNEMNILQESWVMNFWGENSFDSEPANPDWYISVRCVRD